MKNDKMQYGFKDYQGNAWGDSSVDTYNRFNDEVVKRVGDHKKGSLVDQEYEFYLDQRHKTFVQLVGINAKN